MARRVFISYAPESDEHRQVVRDFWVFLRQNGVDAQIDWPAAQRRRDWSLWTADQIRSADAVLCVASEQYRASAEGRGVRDEGLRSQWATRLIRDAFHATPDNLDKFVPVVLPGQSIEGVPHFLAPSSSTVYFVADFTLKGAEGLLRLLLEQPEIVEPQLGEVPVFSRANVAAAREETSGQGHRWDVFLCHAPEDREKVALPLTRELAARGVRVWFDAHELRIGDSLRESVDEGLARSRFGIVVLSEEFLAKRWPRWQLDGLFARQVDGLKVILPVWHGIDRAVLLAWSPTLADRVAGSTEDGIERLATSLAAVIRGG